MGIDSGFFKAKNRDIAYAEIVSRLGGASESTDFLTNYILNIAKNDARMKKFPIAVFVHETKPQFALNDGEMLDGYAVDLGAKKEIGSKYMGSADSVYHHQKEQLSEGMTVPTNIVAVFITRIPSSGKLAWTVDIVGNIQKRIESKNNEKLEEKSPPRLQSALKRAITDELHEIGKQYWENIPLQEMFSFFEKYGLAVLQEDNTPWSGLLCGEKGTFNAQIGVKRDNEYVVIDNAGFCFTWYKMESGKYEIVAYIS